MLTSTYHSLRFSRGSTKGYTRYNSKEEEKNNLMELKGNKGNVNHYKYMKVG